jgi:hypothetical protein
MNMAQHLLALTGAIIIVDEWLEQSTEEFRDYGYNFASTVGP